MAERFIKEYLESWNEIFSDCTIKEKDLKQLTEEILTKMLVSYLRVIGYQVEPPFPNGTEMAKNTPEKRFFLLKIKRHIDEILQITKQSCGLTYYDLICPTSKKMCNMLEILMNYLYYYNMYKNEVFQTAHDRITEHQALLAKIECMREEEEKRSKNAIEIKNEMCVLATKLADSKLNLEILRATATKHKENECKLVNDNDILEMRLDDLNKQKRTLQKQIVPNSEGDDLNKQINMLNEMIVEIKNDTNTTESNLSSQLEKIATLDLKISIVKQAKEQLPANVMKSFQDINKTLSTIKTKIAKAESAAHNLMQKIKKTETGKQYLEEKSKLLEMQLQQGKDQRLKLIRDIRNELYEKKIKFKELQRKQHLLNELLYDQQQISTYINDSINKINEARKKAVHISK